jgi:hypothetical protein
MDFTSTWFGVSAFIFPAARSDTWFLLDTLKQVHLVIMGFQKEKKLFSLFQRSSKATAPLFAVSTTLDTCLAHSRNR